MKDPRFNKAIEDIKKISMTSTEKQMVLERVLDSQPALAHTAERSKSVPVKSPWTIYSFNVWIQQHRWVPALAVVVIVLLAGNSAVRASNDALPGESLYSLKVNIVEPVRVALASTPVAKAEIRAELVQKRLQEAETLAARGTLTEAQEQQIEQSVEVQKTQLAINVAEIQKTQPEKAQDINTTVDASISTHERVLSVLAINRGQFRTEKTLAVSTKKQDTQKDSNGERAKNNPSKDVVIVARATKVQPPSVPVVSTPQSATMMSAPAAPVMAGASLTTATPTPAGWTASTVTVETTQKSDTHESVLAPVASTKSRQRTISVNPEYLKKKARLQSLIKQVHEVTASSTNTATSSRIQQSIAEEAQMSLQRAQDSLNDADAHDQNGEADQSYSALVDSERQAKEATLLIKANTRLNKDVRTQEIQKINKRK